MGNGDGRAPSLLNGGLGEGNGVYWASQGLDKQFGKKDDYLPGMLGFDPLGADSPSMRNAEVTHGRVAMVAITAYALEEAITKAPISRSTCFKRAGRGKTRVGRYHSCHVMIGRVQLRMARVRRAAVSRGVDARAPNTGGTEK